MSSSTPQTSRDRDPTPCSVAASSTLTMFGMPAAFCEDKLGTPPLRRQVLPV